MPPMDDWARFIIAGALRDLRAGMTEADVVEKVKTTALFARRDYWEQFLGLLELRRKAGVA